MSIPEKDQKILWGKAAARCAICRKVVVANASNTVPSKNVVVGENCHIVGENEGDKSPRSKSILEIKDRNRYPNLILLCKEHHTVIDDDETTWPVEKLHQIKADHELWVETQLTEPSASLDDELYSNLINNATELLHLNLWETISDHAIRLLLHNDFYEGSTKFCAMIFKTNWPKSNLELEKSIINLSNRTDRFVKHFMSNSEKNGENWWKEDKTWKRVRQENFEKHAKKSREWQNDVTDLLLDLTLAINEFAEEVRKSLNPKYFFFEGKFTVYDSLGVTNDMQGTYYCPSSYRK